jgi:hypothetical protein
VDALAGAALNAEQRAAVRRAAAARDYALLLGMPGTVRARPRPRPLSLAPLTLFIVYS